MNLRKLFRPSLEDKARRRFNGRVWSIPGTWSLKLTDDLGFPIFLHRIGKTDLVVLSLKNRDLELETWLKKHGR